MATFMETILGTFSGDVTRKAAAFLGESPENTQRAVHAAVPTIMASALQKASSPGGAKELFDLVGSAARDGSVLQNLTSMMSGGSSDKLLSMGQGFLSTLMGSKTSAASNMLAGMSGLKSSSASTLLSMATPVVMGILGRETATRGLNPAGFVDFLMGQKNDIQRMAPPGLANVLGMADLSKLGAGASQAVAAAGSAASSGSRKLLPILAIAALTLIAWMLLRGGKTTEIADSAQNAADEAGQRADAFVDDAGNAMKEAAQKLTSIQLPGGSTVEVPEGSFNHGLATFLANANTSQLPRSFVFDHLNFETSTTALTPESQPTLRNLVTILKAYPSATVRLEGHTDTTGDATANQKLSMARADAVKAALVAGGVDAGRIATAGYGATRPAASNETEEGRAQNRRLELVVVKV